MGAGRTEFELKFTGAPGEVSALPQSRLFAALSPDGGAWERLTSTYYDAPGGVLAKHGLSLRLREEGGAFIQAVKVSGDRPASRREIETGVEGASAFPAITGDDQIDQWIQGVADELNPIARTSVDRWAALVNFKSAVIELAVDLGQAERRDSAGRVFSAPLSEVELELVSGGEGAVFELARLLVDNASLRLSVRSKLDYALSLSHGAALPLKPASLAIGDDATPGDVLGAALNSCATRLSSLQASVVDYRRPEGVHQTRVALRRLRATERIFRRLLKGRGMERLAAEAKRIAGRLGHARDWDVFVSETLSATQASDYAPTLSESAFALSQLKAKADSEGAGAWAAAVEEVSSPRFTHFLLDLLEAGALQHWRDDADRKMEQPLTAFAPRALDRALKKARKAAKSARAAEDNAALHSLRIALKKLRYPAQLFKNLYAKEHRKDYMAALSALQRKLGTINDAVTAQHLADIAAKSGGEYLMRAAGFVSGYRAAEAQNAAKEIDAALTGFEKMDPFWRKT